MRPLPPLEPIPSGTLERLRNNYLVQAWLVLILALCFGGALAEVHLKLGPKIEENKLNETRQQIPQLLLGSERAQALADQGQKLIIKPHEVKVQEANRLVYYNVYEARYPDGKLAGWVAKASGQGYSDKIELLVGFDPSVKAITGIFILDQKETPGLGNNIITVDWRQQFKGLKTSQPIVVTKVGAKAPNEINAITGATISSRSVAKLINTTVTDLHQPLIQLAAQAKDKKNG